MSAMVCKKRTMASNACSSVSIAICQVNHAAPELPIGVLDEADRSRQSVAVVHGTRDASALWLGTAIGATLIAVALVVVALHLSTRTVTRAHLSCGSVIKPIDPEVLGPPGTNPRPCSNVHDGDAAISVVLLIAAIGLVIAVVRSRPGRPARSAITA